MKNLPHREIPIRFEKLQKMIEKAEITEAISKIEDKEKLITLWYLIHQNGL